MTTPTITPIVKPDRSWITALVFSGLVAAILALCAWLFFLWADTAVPKVPPIPQATAPKYRAAAEEKHRAAEEKRLAVVTENRKMVPPIAAGLFLILTAFGSWRAFQAADANAKAANENARIANENAKTATANLQVAQSKLDFDREQAAKTQEANDTKLLSERFFKATENLGNEKMPVRLGAIYSLEQMALTSERNHALAFEVLSAFIRERTPLFVKGELKVCDLRDPTGALSTANLLETDVEAAITVIGRRSVQADEWIILDGCFLCGGFFANTRRRKRHDYSNVNFAVSKLDVAIFDECVLNNTSFYDAKLMCARFKRTNCHQTVFRKSMLAGSKFGGAILSDVDFTDAFVQSADFRGVDMSKTIGFVQEQMDTIKASPTTIPPSGLKLPEKLYDDNDEE